MPQIEQLLQPFPVDQRQLRFSFSCGDRGYEARVMLTLPAANLLARTVTPVADHREAIDQVVEKLAAEIRQYQDRVRTRNVDGPRGCRERDFADIEPHLNAMHDDQDREGFFDVVRPLLRQFASHARRELILAQLEGDVVPDAMTVGEMLEAVTQRAWAGWTERPRGQALARWLVTVLHACADDTAGARRPSSYAAETGCATASNLIWPCADALSRDDVLPADDGASPSIPAATAWQRQLILNELRQFPRDQHRAFTLHAFEGWPVSDIAQSQQRPENEVRADVNLVRHALRRRLEGADA